MDTKRTINRLKEMKLSVMAEAFSLQLEDERMADMPFAERFSALVDTEYDTRRSNRLLRLIKGSEIEQKQADIHEVDYESGRRLNRDLIEKLASCAYIREGRNIFITGATGCGKSYLASALGMEACKNFYTVRYARLPDLLLELTSAKESGNYVRIMDRFTKVQLLILDEWLLIKPDSRERQLIFELIHKRSQSASTIFCSQYLSKGWYDRLASKDDTLADAIMDRIAYNSYMIDIVGIAPDVDISMRSRYGLNDEDRR